MHGQYYAVADVDPGRQAMTIASNGKVAFDRGDTLTVYGSDTRCKGSAVIVSLHSVDQPDATDGKISENLSDLKPYAYNDCDFIEVGHGMCTSLALEQPVTETACSLTFIQHHHPAACVAHIQLISRSVPAGEIQVLARKLQYSQV